MITDWTKKDSNINGDKLNHLRFADDIIIIAHAVKDFEVMLQELNNASRKFGLKMNMRKTNIMAGTTRTVYINGIQLNHAEENVYLGQRVALIETNQDNEIRRRIKARWQAFGRYSIIMKGTLPTGLKERSSIDAPFQQ